MYSQRKGAIFISVGISIFAINQFLVNSLITNHEIELSASRWPLFVRLLVAHLNLTLSPVPRILRVESQVYPYKLMWSH